MVVFASFNGPSDSRCWLALRASATVAVIIGAVLRSAVKGFLVGGVVAGIVTLIILGTSTGDIVGLMTAILTPIFGLIGAVAACCSGTISSRAARKQQDHKAPETSAGGG